MNDSHDPSRGIRYTRLARKLKLTSIVSQGSVAFLMVGAVATVASAQQAAAEAIAPLVLDEVTVVDVERGTLVPAQRVVIVGSRIQAIGNVSAITLPKRARVVNAKGKYLIPGLWDMHVHLALDPRHRRLVPLSYQMLLATGVTGLRDPGTALPLDTLARWRREILAGTRVGPPRQLFSGPMINGPVAGCERKKDSRSVCVADSADARHLVDSLQAAGADMIKMYSLSRELYFVVAAAARQRGMLFGGHAGIYSRPTGLTVREASDSGARIIDHTLWGLDTLCYYPSRGATVERCRPVAERFRHNGTWSLANVIHAGYTKEGVRFANAFWTDSGVDYDRLRDHAHLPSNAGEDLSVAYQAGLPTIAGTDIGPVLVTERAAWLREEFGAIVGLDSARGRVNAALPVGFQLHAELARQVAWGMSPLATLQAATLNPAKALRATDSLGTVAQGKLADLVLLDADPLTDIWNTVRIRAVVANGRYYDRAALDQLLAEVKAKVGLEVKALNTTPGP